MFWSSRYINTEADRKDDGSKTDDTATVSGVDTEEPPTTYMIKEKYEYFKPRVEVETEEEGNKSYIKEIFIRGEFMHLYFIAA